jgi:hypothetical protein
VNPTRVIGGRNGHADAPGSRVGERPASSNPRFVDAFGYAPVITKPASNADPRGAFLLYEF